MWIKFTQSIPDYNTQVLILFRSGHIEDATIHPAPDGDGWTYCLFDGEQLNDAPTHWMPRPTDPKKDQG